MLQYEVKDGFEPCVMNVTKNKDIKHIGDVETDKYSLEVYECKCGFHLGLDATYLEQVGDICIICPSCNEYIRIKGNE